MSCWTRRWRGDSSCVGGVVWAYALASGLLPDKETWADFLFASLTFASVGVPDSSSRTARKYFFANALAGVLILIVKWAANFDLLAHAMTQSNVPVLVVGADYRNLANAPATNRVPDLIGVCA